MIVCLQNKRILSAALEKGDIDLLVHIQGKDMVAIEVQYHRQCFKAYTRERSTTTPSPDTPRSTSAHSNAYEVFKERIILGKIVQIKKK
jgi:hypothetical protein